MANSLREIREALRDRYLSDDPRPWVVGYSAGKDSSLVLHLAVETAIACGGTRPLYVAMNDTGVENPVYAKHMSDCIEAIESWADREKNNIRVRVSGPDVDNTFWVNVIGRGYRAPTRHFRWCTDRMKIRPTNRFFSQIGGAVILIGTRSEESRDRAERLSSGQASDLMHKSGGNEIMAPIRHLTDDEVWQILLQSKAPWGGGYRHLWSLYRKATGECPYVISKDDAPSCGSNSARFGCWTCTVVTKDHSAEAMAASGSDGLMPYIEFREWLREISEDHNNRDPRRRNGQPGVGPFKMHVRQEILSRLQVLQEDVGRRLITDAEVRAIKAIWAEDGGSSPLSDEATILDRPLMLPALQASGGLLVSMTFADVVKAWPVQAEDVRFSDRYQRDVSYARAKNIAKYILGNDDWVLPAMTCLVGGLDPSSSLAVIHPDEPRIISDGQHRRVAIQMVLEHDRSYASRTIGVQLLPFTGHEQAAQWFADINSGSPATKAAKLALEQRSPSIARQACGEDPWVGLIEMVKPTPRRSSPFLWSLSALDATSNLRSDWWRKAIPALPRFDEYRAGKVAASTLRAEMLWAHKVGLVALGILSESVPPESVGEMPWARADDVWERLGVTSSGRIVARADTGKIIAGHMLSIESKSRILMDGERQRVARNWEQ